MRSSATRATTPGSFRRGGTTTASVRFAGRSRRSAALGLVAVLGGTGFGCRARPVRLELSAREYGYQMASSVPAGLTRIELRNDGTDIHEGMLVRFTDSAGSAARYVDSVRAKVDYP